MNENEQKQWVVNRLETYLIMSHDEIEADKEDFEKLSEQYLSVLEKRRNTLLAAVGFIATVVILGLASLGIIEMPYVILFLAIDLSVGLAIFVVYNYITAIIGNELTHVWTAHYETLRKIEFIQGHIAGHTLFLDTISPNRVNLLHAWSVTAVTAADYGLIEAYERASKAKYLSFLSGHFDYKMREKQSEYDVAYGNYKTFLSKMPPNEILFENIKPILKPMEEMYKKEQDQKK